MNDKKHAAIYCRVSTANDQINLQNQVEKCMNEAQRLGYTVNSEHIFQDSGSSIASLGNRPWLVGLLKTFDDSRKKVWMNIEAVIVIDFGRITRDRKMFRHIMDFFGNFSAKIFNLNNKDLETIEDKIIYNSIHSVIYELFR